MKQKYSHLRQAEEKSETHYLKSKIWWYVFEFLATCRIFLVYGSDRIFLINYLCKGKCMMYFIILHFGCQCRIHVIQSAP